MAEANQPNYGKIGCVMILGIACIVFSDTMIAEADFASLWSFPTLYQHAQIPLVYSYLLYPAI